MPKISIIVPVYNVEQYLRRCVDSILAQTYTDFEVLLVNDGSTDGSGDICDAYAEQDSRIRVIHQANAGQAAARNRALDVAEGEYIAFVDSDDYIHSKTYEILLMNLNKTGAQISIGGYRNVDSVIPHFEDIQEISVQCHEGKSFLRHCILNVVDKKSWVLWDKVYHRSCFEGIRMPEGRIFEDNAIVYQIIYNTARIVDCDAPLYYYYFNSASTTHKEFNPRQTERLIVTEEMISYFDQNAESELLEYMEAYYLRDLVWLHYRARTELNDKKLTTELRKKAIKQYHKQKPKGYISLRNYPELYNELFPRHAYIYWTMNAIYHKILNKLPKFWGGR